MRSIEEEIEDLAKKQLGNTKYYTKTESINKEIEEALKMSPSKAGGVGYNYPDIKLFIQTPTLRQLPVMIECKGKKGDFIKEEDGEIVNTKKDGTPNYANIKKYAVNGAIHYAKAIIDNTNTYKEVIAIGYNGYYEATGNLVTELGVYYVSLENYCIPKKIGEYSDLSFLQNQYVDKLIEKIDKLGLTDEEIEQESKRRENEIEIQLKELNQEMQDTLQISVGSRVELITGMIMAGLGVEGKVSPLEIVDLKGEQGEKSNDGFVILNKIESFLSEKNLPQEKKTMIINDLSRVFIFSDLWKAINGESKLKVVYRKVKNNIMPIFTSARHLDFTGKLFNVLNAWVDIPDSDKNDVVLTPRYVTDLMARLAQVNMNSYVWDYAVGSAGFLISAMKIMIEDVRNRITSLKERNEKITNIKCRQLLGVEKRSDIYLLAVLNMIIMGDGSSNIIHKDSLTEYEGKYEQGEMKGSDFPANVFLLNPPYSAEGKGFVFVEKALNKMNGGRACILIQENAGSGAGLPYTARILKKHTLLASIHMPDIFIGKAGVQTAIYLFEVGRPHNEKQLVKFLDFSNDGYTRQNKRKSSQDVNLRNTANAIERYNEAINLILYGKSYLEYFTEKEYIEDTISLKGDDWTFNQHKKINSIPVSGDIDRIVVEHLAWRIAKFIKETEFKNIENDNHIDYKSFQIGELFECVKVRKLPYKAGDLKFMTKSEGTIPVLTAGIENQGLAFYAPKENATIINNAISVSANGANSGVMFYQPYDFTVLQDSYAIKYKLKELNEYQYLYFVGALQKVIKNNYNWTNKSGWNKIKKVHFSVPFKNNEIDYGYMEAFIKARKEIVYKNLKDIII